LTGPEVKPGEAETRPAKRSWWKYFLLLSLLGAAAVSGLLWYASTDSFQAYVRLRLIAKLEEATGGRVELASFHAFPKRLQVEVNGITIHGSEAADEIPFAHVDRLAARVKIVSVLGMSLGFDSLELDHPVIHIINYPGGKTNQPQPAVPSTSTKNPVEELFSLSIGRLQVRNGELLLDAQAVPFSFAASDVSAQMTYSLFRQRYESHIAVGKADIKYTDLRPFACSGEAAFVFGRQYIDVSSLKLQSGNSKVEAKGGVSDFKNPRITADYTVKVDLTDAASILRRRDIHGGTLELQGKGTWSVDQAVAEGKAALKDFDYRGEQGKAKIASVTSDYWVTSRQLRLTKMDLRLLGGGAAGDVEIVNWLAPTEVSGKNHKPSHSEDRQRGLARFRLRGISVPELAFALTTLPRPLDRPHLAGSLDGSVDARWTGSASNSEVKVALDINPPASPKPGELPLKAHTVATYRAHPEEVEVKEFTASTPGSQLQVSGRLSSASALNLNASTNNLDEWMPIVRALNGPTPVEIILHGPATFRGTAMGRLPTLIFAGRVQASDFDTLVPASAESPARQIHWDSLSAGVRLAPDSFGARDVTLVHDDTQIHLDLRVSLYQRHFTDQSNFTLQLNVHQADLAELESLLGYSYNVSGAATLSLNASGTRAAPQGSGHLVVTDAKFKNYVVSRVESDLALADGEIQLDHLKASGYGGEVNGNLAYNLDTNHIRLDVAGSGFELAKLSNLQGRRFAIGGRLDFKAEGSGTLDTPAMNADLEVHDLTLDNERAGDFSLITATQGTQMHLTGRSHFKQSELKLDGDVNLQGDLATHATLAFSHLDVDSLIRIYFGGRITGHSAIAGELTIDGPLRKPRQLTAQADINDVFVDVENIKLGNSGPIQIALRNQVLYLEQLHLVGDVTDFNAKGSAQLSGDRALDLRGDGEVNMQLIESFNPDFTTAGTITTALSVTGTMKNPILQGKVQIVDGSISYVDLPSGLSGLNGSLVFTQDRLQIDSLTAHTGGGTLNLGGFMTYYQQKLGFDLTATAQEVRFRYPPGVSSTANADLRFAGSTAGATLTGDLTVTKLAVTPGFDFGSYLAKTKASVTVPNPNSLLNNIKLDVHVTTTPDLEMQTAMAKLSGNADLRMRGTLARPAVLGRVDIVEGEVSFNGAKYRLERGDVIFTNPVRIEPVLDLQATTRVSDYDITLGINGTTDKLNLTYRSEPPLPSADIIALLAMGRTREESAALQGSSPDYGQASSLILGQALNSIIANRSQSLFGVSRLRIDPQGVGGETSTINRGPLVTIEQQVYNNLTITYSTNVSQSSQQIIQGVYNLTRNISIVGLRDYNGVISFDLRIRQRKK
jgi:translocation and assembly module TamB